GPWASTKTLRSSGHALLGASAIRCSYHTTLAQAPLDLRFDNVLGWNARVAAGDVDGVIHTCWGRSNSLRPVYGPWQGWLPAFIAAANPEAWRSSPMQAIVNEIIASMKRPPWESFQKSLEILCVAAEQNPAPRWRQAAAWWAIAVK